MNPSKNDALVTLRAPDGAQATVSLHGGQLLSWIPAGGEEQLYASPLSVPAAGSALRGGVPVIFPQFALQGPYPRHGIARTRTWSLVQREQGVQGDALAVLRLEDDADTLRLWPHAFALELTVRIAGSRLEMELAVENRGEARFSFQAALHSYWRVQDLGRVQIEGLQDRRYCESDTGLEGVQHSHRLELLPGKAIDRIVYGPASTLRLVELGEATTRRLLIESEGFDDVVVWNPGADHGLPDLPAADWQHFVCVEAAQIEHPPVLEPGDEWVARQALTAR
ncbi:D-hexose-6-phosphate mutarotase [Inhella gelatinilytica]|uniref:Putative glucose-6-phosphate 1-epimerase n=1 Tax=Inhella gelatinilytica TaxID=2795030 RepID=A0A931IU60_9BURK|nr:D-hexose-6-phosphate mutarotase [Inhella gelatinilytica]MBH9551591.1 D-hexose-6-phosphate mutarotase [Inhella gelatinilytica]